MRGTTSVSPWRRARRVALATSVSVLDTVRRTDTPERWLTCGLLAGQVGEGGHDLGHELGHVDPHPGTSKGRASWRAMATSVSTSSG